MLVHDRVVSMRPIPYQTYEEAQYECKRTKDAAFPLNGAIFRTPEVDKNGGERGRIVIRSIRQSKLNGFIMVITII
jgi:hypothetical protein